MSPHKIYALFTTLKRLIKKSVDVSLQRIKIHNKQTLNFSMEIFNELKKKSVSKGVTGQKAFWNQPSEVWKKIFITYHPDGDAYSGSSKWFHEDAWLTANGVEVWKVVNEVYPVMLSEYKLEKPVKPSLFLEGSYEFGSYQHECGWITPVKVRRQIYHTFFAGGAGHTYGAGPIWAMRGNSGDYSCGYTWQQALDFTAAVQFTKVAQPFLQKNQWNEWQPNSNIIIGNTGVNDSLKVAVSTTSGQKAIVYFSNNSKAKLKNILGKEAEALWYDPRNGETKRVEKFQIDETKEVVPPYGWEDGLLVLEIK